MKRAIVLVVVLLLAIISLGSAKAATTFNSNFEGGFNGNSAISDNAAYTDGVLPSLVSGYGGGQAVKNTLGTTLKYKTSNLNQDKDSISFKFQLPFSLTGDHDINRFSDPTNSYITVDPSTEYIYTPENGADRIVRTKIDGTGWQSLGTHGSGKGQFQFLGRADAAAEPGTGFVFISDGGNHRIVKTRIDGSGWETFTPSVEQYGETSFSPGRMNYDSSSGFLYLVDTDAKRLIRTKFGGEGFEYIDVSDVSSYPGEIVKDPNSDYIYFNDALNYRMVKMKWDKSNKSYFLSQGSGVNQVSGIYDIIVSGDYLYINDEGNNRIIKSKFGGEGWTTFGSRGYDPGQFYYLGGVSFDPNTEYFYILEMTGRAVNSPSLVKTKFGGEGWTSYGTQGFGRIYNSWDMTKDETTGKYYMLTGLDSVIESYEDGSDWKIFGVHGDGSTAGTFGYITGLDIDTNTKDLYFIDHYINGIIKTDMDGSKWQTYKGPNGDDYQTPRGLAYDQDNGYVYGGAMWACKVVKSKIDGTGWSTYGSCGDGDGQFSTVNRVQYDEQTGWVYATDFDHAKVTRFKMDGGDPQTQVLDASTWLSYGPSFAVEYGTDYIYTDADDGSIVRVKMDGTDKTSFYHDEWTQGWNWPFPLYYESDTNSIILTDSYMVHRVSPPGRNKKKFQFQSRQNII